MKLCAAKAAACAARRGFTMLELVVVLSLLTIITAAVVPLYAKSMSAIQMRNARNDFVALLSFVQERAVSDSREYRIYLDTEKGGYWVSAHTATEDRQKIFEDVEQAFGRERLLPPYLELDRVKAPKDRKRGVHYIGCYPNGASDRVQLTFKDTRNRRRRFRVRTEGVMGKLRVEDKW